MVELYIDNMRVNSQSEPLVTFRYDAKVMRTVDAAREPRRVSVEVALDDSSAAIFGGMGYLHAASRFNAAKHSATIRYEGNEIFEGVATLLEVRREGSIRILLIEVSDEGAEWATAASGARFNTVPIEDELSLNMNTIKERWEGEHTLQFFPVQRDDYENEASSADEEIVRRIYTIDRYHPFLNVGDLLRAIFDEAGYLVESKILEKEHFKRLFMSGSYVSQRNTGAKDVMDFYLKKLSDESTTASPLGIVYISPYVAGNCVETFVDYDSIEELDECYSRGAYISLDEDGVVTFTPPSGVSVGFEYRIKYTTGYWIESRSKLKAFDTVYFGEGDPVQFDVVNRFVDLRGATYIQHLDYFVVVFDYSAESGFRLRGANNGVVVASWSGRTTTFSISDSADYGELVLEVLVGASYLAYEGDWAQYYGYVEERGNTQIDVSIRTAPNAVSPNSPRSFDPIIFSGAEAGTAFTLHEGTAIRPFFSAYPGSGSEVEFADIAQLDMSQGDFIEAIQHLFNLRYYSDVAGRKIYLDPVEEIYDRERVWDWSDRIVESEPILYEDVAKGVARSRIWGYQRGDGVTNRSATGGYYPGVYYPLKPEEDPEQSDEAASSPEYGAWRRDIENYAAAESERSILNPEFSPTQNNTRGIPIVGDRDDMELAGSLEFTPRLVRWLGSVSLDGEVMPLTAFHSPEHESTLCFEDRDGLAGLNQYYREQIAREERGEYVTLSLRMSVHEFASLLSPSDGVPHVLSTFGLTIDGEWAECWIEAIEEYRVNDEVARVKMLIVK